MSLASGDLTTIATAKTYVQPLPSDTLLQGLISRVSMMIRGHLNRGILVPTAYTEQRDGTGTRQLVLPHYPLIGSTLTSLKVSGVSIPIAPQVGDTNAPPPTVPYGYRFQPWNGLPPGSPAVVELIGFYFSFGHQNVVVQYSAGYEVVNEAQSVPANPGPYTITPLTPFGSWATDQGVKYAATGVALTAVSGAPATGQYNAPNPGASSPVNNYTFASGDAGAALLLSYGYIPADVEQAALETIAERASYRTRVGVRSQVLAAQETINYDTGGLSNWVKEALRSYVSVLPPAMGANV